MKYYYVNERTSTHSENSYSISDPGIVTLLKVVRSNIATLNSSGYNSHNGEEGKKSRRQMK